MQIQNLCSQYCVYLECTTSCHSIIDYLYVKLGHAYLPWSLYTTTSYAMLYTDKTYL